MIEVRDRAVDGDKVFTRTTMRGANLHTGDTRTVERLQIHRVENGRIAEVWSLTAHFTSLDAPAPCPRNCSGNGLCHRGICACAPGFAGYGCEVEAQCKSNCSSHGVCVHGQCFCDLGYGGEGLSVFTGIDYPF